MVRRGEVYENPVTGEKAVIRVGTAETGGERLVVDLFVAPHGRVLGEHYHPSIRERFTVVRGQVGISLNGSRSIATIGESVDVPAKVVHDWWNAGEGEAHVMVAVEPAARFEAAVRNTFCLAQDGKTDARGMPNLLQLAVFALEFDDVMRFTRPPRFVQLIMFNALAPIARLMGYRGDNPEYMSRPPKSVMSEVELDTVLAK
jgi:quercetin dioxygenase-like cupin family protein